MRISTAGCTADSGADDAFEIVSACREFDRPDLPGLPRSAFLAEFEHPLPGRTYERYLGLLGGRPVGYLRLSLPQRDNRRLVLVELMVLPRYRRRGIGRALLEVAVRRAREAGRDRLTGQSVQTRPDGGAFAEAVGGHAALQQVCYRLDLETSDQDRLDALLAEAWKHAEGYRLVQWIGAPPDDLADGVAALTGRVFAEAPFGDLDLEPQNLDGEQIRRAERASANRGWETVTTGVLAAGELVGLTSTELLLAEPTRAEVTITLVRPGHRGHRLGLVLKLENLRLARSRHPELRFVDTRNAVTNAPMVAINRMIGYAAVESIIQWQLPVA